MSRSPPSRGLQGPHGDAQRSHASPRLNNTWSLRPENSREAKPTSPLTRARRMPGPLKLERAPAHWSSTTISRAADARSPAPNSLRQALPSRDRRVPTRNASPGGARTWGSSSRHYTPRQVGSRRSPMIGQRYPMEVKIWLTASQFSGSTTGATTFSSRRIPSVEACISVSFHLRRPRHGEIYSTT